jgi:hypothetical protein
MPDTSLFLKRFAEIDEQARAIIATKKKIQSEYRSGEDIEHDALLGWSVKAMNLIGRTCGEDSIHYKAFLAHNQTHMYSTSLSTLRTLISVFNAAREDYEGGYIVGLRSLISAEVFSSELEQARELHSSGYHSAAAVVAGTVLETTLRQMCDKTELPHGKLDKMNADLVKAGAYNTLVQKRITAIAGVRNSAAHGKPTEFTADDVADMIAYVEKFTSEHV